jgi:DNA-binding GntR family transcriptional regulator
MQSPIAFKRRQRLDSPPSFATESHDEYNSDLGSRGDSGNRAASDAPAATPRPAVSLHDGLLAALRDYIVEGNLADGARIPERLLCDRFGISRTPLREALKVLAAEGLIDLLPNRGARVREFGSEDLRELFDVMGGLEALAGRLACERISDD